MFGRGTRELMERLPHLQGLEAASVRRLLSRAWLEVAERRELRAPEIEDLDFGTDLRRLAISLQVHGVVVSDLDPAVRAACAFVAAEALDIAHELGGAPQADPLEPFIIGLLYLVSGYDANAAVAVGNAAMPADIPDEEAYALGGIAAFLTGAAASPLSEDLAVSPYLHARVRQALWRRLGSTIGAFNEWLRDPTRP